MKNWSKTWIPALLLMSLLSGSAWAQGKIATVDLRKVFDNYWRKKQAEDALKVREDEIKKDDTAMMDEYKKLKEDYTSLQSGVNEGAISPEERDKRKKAAEDKLKSVKNKEDEITQYERTAAANLNEQKQRMRTGILNEIRNIVAAKAKSAGFALVVDTAGESTVGTPLVLYSNNENDLTDTVLLQLNQTAPTDTAPSEDKPADKKGDKKKETKK
ncbi:MAG TPA: OmpH family outer membrane protein [Candidatus Binatia bacterium]|nr:OmpH family outer membrane protein [Candidatus Binatia bacterium]